MEAATYSNLTDIEKDVYDAISDLDRTEFITAKVMEAYYYYLDLLVTYSPVFDPLYYATIYPEKGKIYGSDRMLLLSDFMDEGMAQGLQGSINFNVHKYMINNPDLVAVYGNNLPLYYKHYITNGQYEGRIAY